MKLGALNLILHPHSPERYVRLLQRLCETKQAVKYYGEKGGALARLHEYPNINNIYYGEFFTFTNIDLSRPWLDGKNLSPIVNEEGAPIPQVPENLKPNLKTVLFVFHPDTHRLVFDTQNISPNNAKRLVSGLCSADEIVREFGDTQVIIESSRETIYKILKIPQLSKLTIKTVRPNPDDIGGPSMEAEVYRRMEEQGVQKQEQIMTAGRNGSITPSPETQGLMEVSVSNGMVIGEGYDDDQKVVESTKDHPHILTATYDPKIDSLLETMLKWALEMIHRITGRQ